jgi:hypothetical protein
MICYSVWRIWRINNIDRIDNQVIIVTIEIYLVKTTHGLCGMVTIGYCIPVARQCFMKEKSWHIPQHK